MLLGCDLSQGTSHSSAGLRLAEMQISVSGVPTVWPEKSLPRD